MKISILIFTFIIFAIIIIILIKENKRKKIKYQNDVKPYLEQRKF